MKKIILFAALTLAAFTASSCASNDDEDQSEKITFVVDGVSKTYTVIDIQENGSEVIIDAAAVASSEEHIEIKINTQETVTTAVYSIMYYKTDLKWYHGYLGGTMVSKLQVNSGNRLKGTFSGTLDAANDNVVIITKGTFNISY